MEESIIKLKAAAALLQNMVSTEEEVRYNDLALFYIARLLYEGIDELEEFSDELKNDKLKYYLWKKQIMIIFSIVLSD